MTDEQCMDTPIQTIELKETLNALRKEISEAILVSEGKEVRFQLGEIELEIQVAIEKIKEGSGGIKFWVIGIDGGRTDKKLTTHTIRIPIKPIWKDGKPILTGSSEIPK